MSKTGESGTAQSGNVAALQTSRATASEVVSRVRQRSINDLLQPREARTQALEGFEEVYSDIVH